ncbi:hypothetical protein VTN02DRAFT_1102 [Thermoascus thermophilus]
MIIVFPGTWNTYHFGPEPSCARNRFHGRIPELKRKQIPDLTSTICTAGIAHYRRLDQVWALSGLKKRQHS